MTEHIVTAIEPAWVQSEYRPDPSSGRPDYVGMSTEVLHSDGLDELFHESSYECSCEETLSNWHEVQEHFEDVTNDDTEEE